MLERGEVEPLQCLAYSFADAVPAFRQFARAQHVGKVVTRMPAPADTAASEEDGSLGSWLISGGLGSLGVLVADWLAGQGQAHIVLLGRTGRAARPPDAASTVLAGSSAAEVAMYRCDTSLASEVAGIGATCLGTLPVLAGIINSGGVLADAILSNQTAASVRASFAPKLMSVQAMQREAAGLPVGQQLLFSSVASLLGSPGQANYAAANAALEGWAAAACSRGVNSIALQWGAWAVGECLTSKADGTALKCCRTLLSNSREVKWASQHQSCTLLPTYKGTCTGTSALMRTWVLCAGMAANDLVTRRALRSGVGIVQPSAGLDALASVMAGSTRPHLRTSVLTVVPFDWGLLLKVRLLGISDGMAAGLTYCQQLVSFGIMISPAQQSKHRKKADMCLHTAGLQT